MNILKVSCKLFCARVAAHQFSPAEDLVGLKVSHDFEEMDEGDARILTLKDSRILDDEGTLTWCLICWLNI